MKHLSATFRRCLRRAVRGRVRRLAGPLAAAVLAVLPVATRAADLAGPIVSGLPWRSGAAAAGPGFDAWRGRPRDVAVLFPPHGSWTAIAAWLRGGYFGAVSRWSPQPVVSMPMLTDQVAQQHGACATGAFDRHFLQFGRLLVRAGAGNAVVRLGWEANLSPTTHPWSVGDAAQIPAYVACFRREALALKSAAPDLRIEWTMAKRGVLPVSVMTMYPGDDVVDIMGVHYYNIGPQKNTQAIWDKYANMRNNGGPWGIDTWLAEAKKRSKKLAVSEWALWDRGQGAAHADDPVYLANMYQFFRKNAPDIAYESYFNSRGPVHQLYPLLALPRSTALYRQLWGKGR